MKLRILIADDEPLARARLRALVEEVGHEVCAEAADGPAAKQALEHSNPDALLLDIQMPGDDGLCLARQLEQEHPELPVVLVTAHSEHALAAFDAAVKDYLLKPVRRERLAKALERVAESCLAHRLTVPKIRVTVGRKEQLVSLDEITCFVAEDGYVVAKSARIDGFVDMRLHELEERFGDKLIRVHRSCLVLKSAIAGIESPSRAEHRIVFRDGTAPVFISRRHYATLRAFLRQPDGSPAQ
jgi:two-component system, LytTR family, response regulator AlgR